MRNLKISSGHRGVIQAGFTLIELMVAAAIFTIITGAALTLFAQHQPIFNQQQNQAALNIAIRNAVAQMQVDLVNGGAGYYNGIDVPYWPVGVVINNNVVTSSGDCATGTTYGSSCFDSFIVIKADPNTTPVNPLSGTSTNLPVTPGTCSTTTTDTSATTSIYMLPPTGVTAATYAGDFYSGDQILLVKSNNSNYTTVKLSAAGGTSTVGGTTYVVLTHSTMTANNGTNAASDDQTGMSVQSVDLTTSQFCATDWVVRLTPIEYDVDITTNSASPTLRRTVLVQGQTPSANGVPLMNQVIGFKVGASLVNNASSTAPYDFDASTFTSTSSPHGYDYTLVRDVMISLIGRTNPSPDPTYVFRNSFDGGPYQIQGVSVVVNPRNLGF